MSVFEPTLLVTGSQCPVASTPKFHGDLSFDETWAIHYKLMLARPELSKVFWLRWPAYSPHAPRSASLPPIHGGAQGVWPFQN